ncbi:unnamed protein product [Agarophyton chilense]
MLPTNRGASFSAALALFLCLHLTTITTISAVTLERLSRFRRRCYSNLPMCIMQSNNASSRGCGQCDADIREAPLRHARNVVELRQIERQTERAIVLVPERVFFSVKVRSSIRFLPKFAALIVYRGPPERPDEFVDEAVSNETLDPLFNYSLEESEPNRLYNFYGDIGSEEQCNQSNPRRNNPGDCILQQFIPFNVFHINSSFAGHILQSAARFRDPNAIPDTEQKDTFSPQYKLQSIGRMWACATSMTPTPSATITSESTINDQNAGSLITSQQCLKDKTCLPIGTNSVWSALGRVRPITPALRPKYLFITAPMDSYAFFPQFGTGAGAEIASLAVLMAVSAQVAVFWRDSERQSAFERQPVYIAFNAETWGYAGSSRFLRDMMEFNCTEEADFTKGEKGCNQPFIDNLKFKEFKDADIQVLNIGQLITPATTTEGMSDSNFFAHYENGTSTMLESDLRNSFEQRKLEFQRGGFDYGSDVPLTPIDASQSFKFYFKDRKIDVVSITNYPLNFSTEIYHSALDTKLRISRDGQRGSMYEAAHAIASAVVSIALKKSRSVQVNTTIIDNVITCMTGNWTNCPMIQEYLGEDYENIIVEPGNYAGPFFPAKVLRYNNPSAAGKLALVRAFFAHHNRFTESTVKCARETDCAGYNRDINEEESPKSQSDLLDAQCTRGRCVVSDTYSHRAFGGGINMVDPKGVFELEKKYARESFDGNNPRQGDWAESFWDPDTGFCEQVRDSIIYEAVVFGVGLCVLVLSFGFGIWLDRALFEDKTLVTGEESSISSIGELLIAPV